MGVCAHSRKFFFLDFRQSMMIFKIPVARYYIIAAFLTNVNSLYYGNQTAKYFGAEGVSVVEYLDLVE